MADIATGKMIRESAKTVAVSNGNVVITKNDGTTVNNTSNSISVTASTQSAVTPSTTYAFTTEGGAGTIKIPNVSTGLGAGTYTLQNLLQQLVNRSHAHGTTSFTSGADTDTNSYCSYCYYDSCSSSSCIIRGKVLTDKGEIEIQDLKIGDALLGIDGKYHKMVGIKLSKLGERQAVYFAGFNSAIFTDDHLFITAEGNYAAYDKKGYLEKSITNLTDGKVYGTYGRLEKKEIVNLKKDNIVLRLVDGTKVCFLMEVNDNISYDAKTYTPIVEDCEWIYVNGIPAACARKI